jgi:hypothetical protein
MSVLELVPEIEYAVAAMATLVTAPVIVTGCGVDQFAVVNVSALGLTVPPSTASLEDKLTVTDAVGAELSTKLKLAVAPAVEVDRPPVVTGTTISCVA